MGKENWEKFLRKTSVFLGQLVLYPHCSSPSRTRIVSGASSIWVAVSAKLTHANFTGFAEKHKLILNPDWYLSNCPEHLDPRDGSTPHLDWISKLIGSYQLGYVCV